MNKSKKVAENFFDDMQAIQDTFPWFIKQTPMNYQQEIQMIQEQTRVIRNIRIELEKALRLLNNEPQDSDQDFDLYMNK